MLIPAALIASMATTSFSGPAIPEKTALNTLAASVHVHSARYRHYDPLYTPLSDTQGFAECSGFVIGNIPSDPTFELVLTAAHCVSQNPIFDYSQNPPTVIGTESLVALGVTFADGDSGQVDGVFIDPQADAAAFIVETQHSHPPVALSLRGTPIGAPLMLLGSHGSRQYFFESSGYFTQHDATAVFDTGPRVLDQAAFSDCQPGDSGGPVTNAQGRVVGLLVGTSKMSNRAVFTPATELNRFLSSLPIVKN
jgi:S1-C subfamily serine protease